MGYTEIISFSSTLIQSKLMWRNFTMGVAKLVQKLASNWITGVRFSV